MSAAICPECTQDDHRNCDGGAWCDETAFPCTCDCFKADHNPEAIA